MDIILYPDEEVTVQFDGTDGNVRVAWEEKGTVVYVNGKQVHIDPWAEWIDEVVES